MLVLCTVKHIMHVTWEYMGSTGEFPGGRLLVGKWWITDQEVRGRRKADLGEGRLDLIELQPCYQ